MMRLLARLLTALFLTAFFLLLALPTLLSLSTFQPVTLRLLSLSGYKVAAEKIQLSWFSSQYASKVDLANAHGIHVFHVDAIALDQSLINLLVSKKINGPLSLKGAFGLLDLQKATISLFSGTDEAKSCKFFMDSLSVIPSQQKLYRLQADITLEYLKEKGEIFIDGLIADSFELFAQVPKFSLNVQNVPLQLLKPFIPSAFKPLLSFYPKSFFQAVVDKEKDALSASITSPLFKTNLQGKFKEGFFHLQQPAVAKLNLPQGRSWFLPYGKEALTITTIEPAILEAKIKEASLPLDGSVGLTEIFVEANLSGATISSDKLVQPIQAEKILFTGSLKEKKTDILLSLDASSRKKPIYLKFQSQFPLTHLPLNWLEHLFSEAQFELSATDIPLELLKSFDHFYAASYLGKKISLSVNYSSEKKQGEILASTDRFLLQNAKFLFASDTLSLTEPASFQITLPPQEQALLSLKMPTVINGKIQELKLPLNDLENSLLNAHFSSEKNTPVISPLFSEKPLAAHLDGDMQIDKQGKFIAFINFFTENNLKKPSGTVAFNFLFPLKKDFSGALAVLDIKTEQLKGKAEFTLSSSGLLKLSHATAIDYYTSTSAGKALGIDALLLPPKIRLKLRQCELPLFSERALLAKGEVVLGSFSTGLRGSKIFLEDLLLPFRIQGTVVHLKASGQSERNGKKSPFEFDSKIQYGEKRGTLFTQIKSAEFSLREFPQEFLAFLAPAAEKLITSPLNGTLYYEDLDEINNGTLQVDLASKNASLSGKFAIEKTQVMMEPSIPLSLSLKIQERALKYLRESFLGIDNNITMITASNVLMNFQQLIIPRSSEGSLLFHEGSYDLSLQAKPLHFFDKNLNESIQFQEIQAHIRGESAKELLEADFSLIPKSSLATDSYFRFTASLENGFDQKGHLRLDLAKLLIEGSSNDLRSVSFCGLFCPYSGVAEKLDTLIGEPLDAQIYLKIEQKNGVLRALTTGPHGSVNIDGRIDNGVLHLNKPLVAAMEVTSRLGPFVLSEVAPLFSGLYKSKTPLTLVIEQDGFSFPLFDYAFENVRIGSARFDSGQLTFEKSSEVQSLLGFLGTPSSKEINVWMTPAFFSLNNGWITLKRMDALIDGKYHIALFGKVNLITDEIDMTVGLTKSALEKAFKISGIKEGSMLQISLRGTTLQPKLDKGEATAKITALLAASQVPSGVIGAIVDLATTVINPSPPKPTVYPFPWEDGKEQKTHRDEPVERKIIETIEKETKKIFKKLLPR